MRDCAGRCAITVYKWSQTAATNASVDATINWAEGQAPSSVNDSARAMMAAVAKFRDDTSGRLTTAGGTTAYSLTSNQGFTSLALMDGATLIFKMNATCAANPTLNVDGLGAKNLTSPQGTQVNAGLLGVNKVYQATYNNAAGEWIVQAAGSFLVGQLLGTSTNDSASAGNVGQVQTSTNPGGTVGSGSPVDIASISLTAGDWQVSGYILFQGTGGSVMTLGEASFNTTSVTLASPIHFLPVPAAGATNLLGTLTLPPQRFSLASTTTVFLSAQANFSGGTQTIAGGMQALRIR